jgi:hypothetical protein
MKLASPVSEYRRTTSTYRLRPLPGYPLEMAVVGEAATADVYDASSTHATSESLACSQGFVRHHQSEADMRKLEKCALSAGAAKQ